MTYVLITIADIGPPEVMSRGSETQLQVVDNGCFITLKVVYHPLYGMENFVLIWGDMGVIAYHVTLSEGHMIANHPILGNTCAPS